MNRFNILLNKLLIILLVFVSGMQTLQARSDDRQKPLQLEADSADLNKGKGISVYQGNVSLVQGTTHLQADKLVLYHNAQLTLEKMEAFGKPVHFRTQPDGQAKPVRAKARHMRYDLQRQQLILTGNSVLRQNQNTFSSEIITYDTIKDIVKAGKTAKNPVGKGKTGKSSGRVKVVIQPKK